MLFNFTGCSTAIYADDLMSGISSGEVNKREADERFINSQMRFAAELFKASALESGEENILISPLSLQLVLAMTANGAVGQTREEMQALLGGELTTLELNEYLCSYVNSLPSGGYYKVRPANSIWFREDLNVKKDFLQTNADYYGAAAFSSSFDKKTCRDINNWIKQNTDGMIENLIDKIEPNTVMYLVNTLLFEAEWENVYTKKDIDSGVFTSISGERRSVTMMSSDEAVYISDENAVGFIKGYKGAKYSFAVLLPNEETEIRDYISSLTGESLKAILDSKTKTAVKATIPKFSYNYDLDMSNVLKNSGMQLAFDRDTADFSNIADLRSGNIYLSKVLHKTSISVTERGTKAAAVSSVEVNSKGVIEGKSVICDRPFVYMIIDNEAGLPLFIGAVMDIG